jgi:FAD:protein FMN transferase
MMMPSLLRQVIWLAVLGGMPTVCGLASVKLASAAESAVLKFSGPTMGSKYNVSLADLPPGKSLEEVQTIVHTRLGQINLELSTYIPQSELSQFNAHDSTDWFPVSANVARLVEYALKLSADSGGAFDPTIGPIVNLWGFGPEPPPEHAPSAEQIAAVLQQVGYDKLEVRQSPHALRKRDPKLQLDLSALGQGYATDEVFALLDDLGVHGILIDVTGEIRATGCKPNGARWRVAIESPDTKVPLRTIELEDESLATSGSTHNFFEFDGVRYSHTMNPRTGRPVEHNLVSVTVRAPRCLDADAWATTLMVLGPEEGLKWANERKIAALMVEQEGEGYRERTTSKWKE